MARGGVLCVVMWVMLAAGCDQPPPPERTSDADQHRLGGSADARALDAWPRDKPRGLGVHFWSRHEAQGADSSRLQAQYDQRLIVAFAAEATVAQVNAVLEHLQARIVGVSPPLQGAPTLYLEVSGGAEAKAAEIAKMPGVTSAALDEELIFIQAANEAPDPLDELGK